MAQIKDYEDQLENLVGTAIQSIADMLNAENNITSEQEQTETYYKIQEYLAIKWKDEKHNRFMKQKLAKVEASVEDQITNPKYKAQDNGTMCFSTMEEASKAAEILEGKGYKTEMDYDEGYEQVKYWKPGHEPEPEYL